MNKGNFSDLGDEIKDIVQNAVTTMDFHQLNRDIGNTVKGALEEVRYSLGNHRQDPPGTPLPPHQDQAVTKMVTKVDQMVITMGALGKTDTTNKEKIKVTLKTPIILKETDNMTSLGDTNKTLITIVLTRRAVIMNQGTDNHIRVFLPLGGTINL